MIHTVQFARTSDYVLVLCPIHLVYPTSGLICVRAVLGMGFPCVNRAIAGTHVIMLGMPDSILSKPAPTVTMIPAQNLGDLASASQAHAPCFRPCQACRGSKTLF